jgi:UDP-N-acetyl-D-glucosamine dehydrogenase
MLEKIETRNAKIGIFGLGYVGLPLGLCFAEKGFMVLGFDIDEKKIKAISNGKSYIKHIGEDRIKTVVDRKRFYASNDFSRVSEMDALILCVPTPLNKYREPDLSYVITTFEEVLPFIRTGQLISLESTTYPGTTEEKIRPRIESRGFTVGKDIYLVYSPEREDPGNKDFNTKNIPKVVGGTTPECSKIGAALYGAVVSSVVTVSSTKTAEMTKLLENIYRAVNIGLVNEMKVIADTMNIDIWEVIQAAATKPFGFTPFYPGPGLGGHCIPIDPFYLNWKAREYDLKTRFIELAGEINTAMPEWVVTKTSNALNEREKSVKGSRILVLGLSYKKNIDDVRESPSVMLLEMLRKKGANIGYIDPFYPKFPPMRDHYFDLEATPFNIEEIKKTDCVIVATDHDFFDYDLLLEHGSLIIDTRGRFKESRHNIVRA